LRSVGVSIALTVGLLHLREARALRTERAARAAAEAAHRESLALRAALDEVDHGLVLLDGDLRAVFINRAFRDLWKLPDEVAQRRPHFLDLLHHGRDTGAYAVAPHELQSYVAHRMALVRAGDERAIDLRLSDGQVTRFRGKVLPDGGRVLSYGNVTDLVNHAEEQQALAAIDPLTGAHNRRHFFIAAEDEWERFRRHGRTFSLLLRRHRSLQDRERPLRARCRRQDSGALRRDPARHHARWRRAGAARRRGVRGSDAGRPTGTRPPASPSGCAARSRSRVPRAPASRSVSGSRRPTPSSPISPS
jgi:PAS domain-containing protein